MRDTVIFAAFFLLLILAVVLLARFIVPWNDGPRFPPPWTVQKNEEVLVSALVRVKWFTLVTFLSESSLFTAKGEAQMAVEDDLRRLTQVDSIYLGYGSLSLGQFITSWFKGRLQQANDGSWILRSVSTDGAVSGFTLGPVQPNWTSSETPNTGITVLIPINLDVPTQANPVQITTGSIVLKQQLPPELTNWKSNSAPRNSMALSLPWFYVLMVTRNGAALLDFVTWWVEEFLTKFAHTHCERASDEFLPPTPRQLAQRTRTQRRNDQTNNKQTSNKVAATVWINVSCGTWRDKRYLHKAASQSAATPGLA
jgi:hypothetical protein